MKPDFLSIALNEARQGRPVFPCNGKLPAISEKNGGHGCLDATTDEATIKEWAKQYPNANVGIAFNENTAEVGLDLDKDNLPAWLKANHPPIATRKVRTGGGGYHHYFLRPTGVSIPNVPKSAGRGFELKSINQYLIAPGSIHPDTGKLYELVNDIDSQPMPDWLIKLSLDGSKPPSPKANRPITTKIYERQGRNQALAREAGRLLNIYKDPEVVKPMVWAYNQAVCVPPLSNEENSKTWQKSLEKWAAKANEAPEYKPAEDGFHLTKPATSWPEPLAEEAFHGLAGEVVRAIEPHTEGDSAALLTNFLVAFGNSIGRGQHARAEADRHSCNLNIVQVGETSKGRKGSALGHIRELFNRVDPVWTEQRIASGLSSGEGLIWEVRDPIEKTVKGEVTVVDEGITDKRLLVCEAEFSAPLRVMAREGNTLSATIRQAWDSGVLRILTKNSPAKATGAHISILGHVTKAELLRYLNDIEAGNGFANRFLWVCVKRARVLPEGGGCPSYQEIVPKLKTTIDRARNIGELKRDAKARGLWAEIYPELSEGKPGLLGAVTARAEAQVLRLSVIYAVLDGAGEIRPAHLMAALAVWDYCEASARYIFGDALGDSVADRIQGALRQSPEGLSRTNIYQLFSKHTSAARIEQALGLLQTTGRVRYEVRKTEGRPVEVWQAV